MSKFKLKFNKQTIKRNIASMLGSIIMVTSVIPAYMLVTEPEVVQAAGVVKGNVINANYDNGNISFDYGTNFATEMEIVENLVDSVEDYEDKKIALSKVTVKKIIGPDNENISLNTFLANRCLEAGKYTITFSVWDSGGKEGTGDIPFTIKDSKLAPDTKPRHLYYLQGTPVTDEMLSLGITITDTIGNDTLEYTSDTLKKGTFNVYSRTTLDTNKIMNNGKGYDFEYYMTHKEEIDAQNTHTIIYKYQTKGMTKSATCESKVTVIPVFPMFTANRDTFQVHEGYEPIRDENGSIVSFTNKMSLDYIKQPHVLNLKAHSVLKGDVNDNSNYEDCTNSIEIYKTTYADGTEKMNEEYITTSNGVYGADLKGTENADGTFTLEDGTIYPYRGNIKLVFKATNSFKNTRLSKYDSDFDHTLWFTDPEGDTDGIHPDLEDEDFTSIVKPQTDPIINGNDRYMFVDEEISKDNILSKLEASDVDAEGNPIDLTGDIVIGKIDKYDKYGNPMGQIYINDSNPFELDKFEKGMTYISTEEECTYDITFVIKNKNNRVNAFTITMHVVDTKVKKPYIRYTRLQYAAKIAENLDAEGYNVYYDKDSIWMNNKHAYETLMYGLCHGMLIDEGIVGDDEVVFIWEFTHEDVLLSQSWQNESGVAKDGQPVPEGTVVNGYLFEDDGGHYIKYRDEDSNKMIKVYVYSDTIDYGMWPSPELNDLFYETFYDDCCTVDLQHVAYQGKGSYAIIRDEDNNYLYYDRDKKKRMVFKNVPNDLKITKAELAEYEKLGYVWEDTRDYSQESVYEQGLKIMIEKYKNKINSNPDLKLITRIPKTIEDFEAVNDRTGASGTSDSVDYEFKESISEKEYLDMIRNGTIK